MLPGILVCNFLFFWLNSVQLSVYLYKVKTNSVLDLNLEFSQGSEYEGGMCSFSASTYAW